MSKAVTLTRRELDIMAVLWKLGNATVAEVHNRLADDIAYVTVLTMLRNLEAKRFVRHEAEGRAFRYYPRIEPNQAGDGALQRLVSKIYRGSRELLVSRLISGEEVSADELRRMKKLLQDRLDELED